MDQQCLVQLSLMEHLLLVEALAMSLFFLLTYHTPCGNHTGYDHEQLRNPAALEATQTPAPGPLQEPHPPLPLEQK